MNIIIISVTKKTKEIGLSEAIGARKRDNLAQFLIESAVLSLLGGVIGISTGFGGGYFLFRIRG